jgi:hypothetical protein
VTALPRGERVARGFLAGADPFVALSVSCAFAALSVTPTSAGFFVARLRDGFAGGSVSTTAICGADASATRLVAFSLLAAGFARGARLRVVLTAPSSGACSVRSVS